MTGIPERFSAALADRYRIARALGQGGMVTLPRVRDDKPDPRITPWTPTPPSPAIRRGTYR